MIYESLSCDLGSSHVLGSIMAGESMNLVDRVPLVGGTGLGKAVPLPVADEPDSDDEDDDYSFGHRCMMPVSFGYQGNQQLDPYDMDPTNPLSPMHLVRPEIGFEDESTNCFPDQWQHRIAGSNLGQKE